MTDIPLAEQCAAYITIRKSNSQLLSEGVRREALGLPSIGDDTTPTSSSDA